MRKWDYKVFEHRGGVDKDQDELVPLGKKGWELISVVEFEGERRFFLKKEILDTGWTGPN